jgi:homoserine kinase type II
MTDQRPERGPANRPKAPADLLQALSATWDIGPTLPTRDLGGSSTLNLLVDDPQRPVVARIYRPWMTTARLDAMQRTRRHLAAGNLPFASPIATRDGENWITIGNHLVELEPYVSSTAKMDSWERIAAAMSTLGQIHELLSTLELPEPGRDAPASNSIARADLVAGVERGVHRLRSVADSSDELGLAETALRLAIRVANAEEDLDPGPAQLVHGDFWDNNVFFDNGQIVLVTDLDFMGIRPRIDDLALTLYYTNSTFTDDQTSPQRRRCLVKLVDSYDDALEQPLNNDERRSLPLAIVRTALGFIAMMADAESDEVVHTLAREMTPDLAWVAATLDNLAEWQSDFT